MHKSITKIESWILILRNRTILRPITRIKVELGIKTLPPQKSPRPYGFIGGFYQTLKKKINDKIYQNLINNGIRGTRSKLK